MEYPKYLATKFDYGYVREHFPKEKWLPDYKELVKDHKKWIKVKKLKDKLDGKEDITNKIIEEKDEITKKTKYLQYEYKVDPNCKINRLGMDISGIEEIIRNAEKEEEIK